MSKYIFVTLFCLSVISCSEDGVDYGGLETVSIPDFKFEKFLLENGIDSKGAIDGKVLRIDAEKTESLDVSYLGIGNLDGLTAFSNLKTLIAFNNELEEVDLSGSPLLTHLFLGNNNIRQLDLTKNTLLEDVRIANNKLVSLDLSQNAVLGSMECHNNLLESINMNCPELRFFWPFYNQIETIDLSSCLKLREMDIRNNKLISLDVSENLEMTSLRVIENPELTCLTIGSNQIENISKDSGTEVRSSCN